MWKNSFSKYEQRSLKQIVSLQTVGKKPMYTANMTYIAV